MVAYNDESGSSIFDETELIRRLRMDARQMIEDVQRQIGITGPVDFPIADPSEALKKATQEKSPDLLVMGSHARTGLNHFLLGNFAEKILRHISIPIIVISDNS